MKLTIVGDRLLIRPNQLQKSVDVTTDAGKKVSLQVVYGDKELAHEAATTEGTVAQVGPQAYSQDPAPWCKEGDTIHWGKYAGYWITDPESKDDYVVLDPHDILCVIQGEAK